jgi:hypothetical protein
MVPQHEKRMTSFVSSIVEKFFAATKCSHFIRAAIVSLAPPFVKVL